MTTFPSLYISHGSPMVAITQTPAHDFLAGFGRELGRFGAEEFVNRKMIRIG